MSLSIIDGITISDMRKWSGAVYGFSFHCWLRLEQVETELSSSPSYRRQLFKLVECKCILILNISSSFCIMEGWFMSVLDQVRHFDLCMFPERGATIENRSMIEWKLHINRECDFRIHNSDSVVNSV